ncbi:superoxide dismutase family protein [Alteromonas halophila]|uniref:Superoxide dismutase [Cu-Zn] n=1 Tax=Alteromonas halophila TaxID=516698 RepID=A0A918JEH1_9ALTE|nr:superoxide dismutase family protein [Alteromonas halophila]GGW76773.1 superoxide dismutase [Cu-Zn] [Alteromonas halophila]
MKTLFVAPLVALSATAMAQSVDVTMKDARSGDAVGTISVTESEYGLVFTPELKSLTPGGHGFHVHENPSCDSKMKDGKSVPAGAAGSHYDPHDIGQHGYPWAKDSHLGDLPLLYVADDGTASHPVLGPRLSMSDIEGRALMIHAGGDNYADTPEKLGGGGARVLCGVIDHDAH